MPCFFFTLIDLVIGKNLNEGGRQGPFGKKISKNVRNAKRDLVGIVNKTDAKIPCEYHLSDQAKHAGEHDGYRDDSGGAGDAGLPGFWGGLYRFGKILWRFGDGLCRV